MGKRIRVKPGKTQSKISVVMGIIFCCIGLFFVIPNFGAFGIVWTLFAVIITVTSAINAFTDKGVPTHEILMDEADTDDDNSIERSLKKLKDMYEKELITLDEYETKKKELIDKL